MMAASYSKRCIKNDRYPREVSIVCYIHVQNMSTLSDETSIIRNKTMQLIERS